MLTSVMVQTVVIYGVAAILPAAFLLRYIYRLDKAEKEPSSLLWKLVLGGVCSAFCALILEEIFNTVTIPITNQISDQFLLVFISVGSVAVIEEGAKYFFLKKISWHHPAFDYRFDGVVYAIFVSLGFAILENIFYVFGNGSLYIALMRAVLSIPAHMCFGAYMGIYYGHAKVCEHAGDSSGARWNRVAGLLLAMLFHFIYDATLMIETATSTIMFVCIVAFIYIFVFRRIRKEAQNDRIIY